MSGCDVESLIHLLSGDARHEKSSLDDAIANLEKLSTSKGLEPDHISSLMQVIVGENHLGNASTRIRLVRCLVPRADVPHSAVLNALGSMGQLPSSLRLLLFRWIVLVYDIIDDKAPLRHVYDVIFHYIQYDGLRQIVCQLLCYITTREDVKKYRVERLLAVMGRVLLIQHDSADSALVALLSVYKQLSPYLVNVPVPMRLKVWFRPTEKTLARNIAIIQGQRSTCCGSSLETVQHLLECIPPPAKRAKPDAVLSGSDVSTAPSSGRVSASSLTSVEDLCRNIHRLEPPGQSASMLESPLLQHFFMLWSDRSLTIRSISWLQLALGNELDMYVPGDPESPFLSNLLKCLVKFTSFLLEPIPTVEHFLSVFLETWNGKDYQSEVFALLTHLSLQPFEDFEERYLFPLKKLFMAEDVQFRYQVVSTLSSLLGNLSFFEWPRLEQRRRVDDETTDSCSVFPWDEEAFVDFDPALALRLFIRYTEDLLCYDTVENRPHPLLQHAAASFYELVTHLLAEAGIPILCIPRPHLVFTTLLSLDAAAISRNLACFVRCKETLSGLKRSERSADQISTFNSSVLDLCDALWRNLAFANSTRPYPTLLFTLPRDTLVDHNLHDNHSQLSITHHPALLGHFCSFLEKEEAGELGHTHHPHLVPSQTKLRAEFLSYLEEKQLRGVVDFIGTFLQQRQDSS